MERGLVLLAQRETSKLDKRRRIEAAARAAFKELGYERANMREIAKRAGVATGTLFLYAPDKRNLLLWIINDDLEASTEKTFAIIEKERADDGLLDQLLFFFESRYRYWAQDPDLAVHALQEMTIDRDVQTSPSSHHAFYKMRRRALLEHLTDVVRAQQRRGFVRQNEAPEMIARLALAIYNSAMRMWLRTDGVNVEAGLADLRTLLRLAMDGFGAPTGRSAAGTSN
jgi:AcrR family transcriptional regulator